MNISELPVGTVIEIGDEGTYMQDQAGVWYEEHTHCVDCPPSTYTSDYIQQYKINDIKCVSVPWQYMAQAIVMLQDEYGHTDAEGIPITFDTIFHSIVAETDRITKEKDR